MFERFDPESKEHLLKLSTQGVAIFADVARIMDMMKVVVVNGLPLKEWRLLEETGYYWVIDVTYDRYFDRRNDDCDTWYFFKKYPDVQFIDVIYPEV
jgi:hypothetical protein